MLKSSAQPRGKTKNKLMFPQIDMGKGGAYISPFKVFKLDNLMEMVENDILANTIFSYNQ